MLVVMRMFLDPIREGLMRTLETAGAEDVAVGTRGAEQRVTLTDKQLTYVHSFISFSESNCWFLFLQHLKSSKSLIFS